MSKKKETGEPLAIHDTFAYGVIYVYSIPDAAHKGRLKIGSATVQSASPTQAEIDAAAHERIQQQTQTADIPYNLEHAELAVTKAGKFFRDHHVHNVLERSGYKRKSENIKNARSEWFEIGMDIAQSAIQAVKEGREALSTTEKTSKHISPFQFRPNQRDAIAKTTKAIKKKRKRFLWNAKMRFGKTSAAMQVAKENGMQKVIIVTHRPSVSVDWYDDFNKVFAGTKYEYSSKTNGENLSTLLKGKKPFVYFASLQDLRGSDRVVRDQAAGSRRKAGFDKNDEIFDTPWDMLIIDEAHEGTQSDLGDTTFTNIPAKFTLQLSGTPFNILHKHEEEDIYTWDYVMEQEEKLHWDERNPGVPNPYAELPALSILTYDIDTLASHLGNLGEEFHDAQDGAFKFHEFFRVQKDSDGNDTAEFVHEKMVSKFLDLLVDDKAHTKFPYATEAYRSYNKHALWLLPNRVKVIEAMTRLLNEHPVFGSGAFGIVNISGDPQDDEDKDAKESVTNAIKTHEYSITLTGQRLTTGASIPEWTAVFMMSDTNSAITYLQTAFRCQTPATIEGRLKTQGYVFDFAPDRTLKLVAEAIELNHKRGKINTDAQKDAMQKFLNFCPILAAKGGMMRPYDVAGMLNQLKKAIVERVSRNGFDDPALYNDELLKLNEVDIQKFNDLKAIVGTSNAERVNEIEINNLGMDDLKVEEAEKAERVKKELTEEQKEALKKLKEAREQRKKAITILRAVSIRMPMLVYGANVSMREDITLEKFIGLVDDKSWCEFMPHGLTKDKFRDFTKYYDEVVFKGVAKNIRAKAFDCDDLPPTERVEAISAIFSTFKNPDKETVLTPWKVVNQHLTVGFGGHDFTDYREKSGKPVWKTEGERTRIWEKGDSRILEINAKSGLYPLLAAYNYYSRQLKHEKKPEDKVAERLWRKVLQNNIYVLCKSPMAASITRRTLTGYHKGAKTNIAYIPELVTKLGREGKYREYNLGEDLQRKFDIGDEDMKFTAVVGNPPYQINTGTNFAKPVYHVFIDAAKSLEPDYVCLIHPARFLFNAGATPKDWNQQMLNDPHLSVKLYEPDTQKIFPGVDIMGGICITHWDKNQQSGGLGGSFMAHKDLEKIVDKVNSGGFDSLVSTAGGSPTIRYEDKFGRKRSYFRTSAFFDMPEFFLESKNEEYSIKIVGLQKGNKRTERYVKESVLKDSNINMWKVFVPKSNGSGALGEVDSTPLIGEPMIGEPGVGCTESFVKVGPFDKKSHAHNCMKYIKTKFCRTLLGTLKITQDNPKKVWKNVPMQDFTDASDIDWSQSIPKIDKQLYKKYGLDKKEIDFIETHVKAME